MAAEAYPIPNVVYGFPITQMLFADFGRGVEDVVYSTTFTISYLERQLNGSLVDATSAHLSVINSGINLPSFFVAGDVSGDGHLDLVVVTLAGIVYLRNDGQGLHRRDCVLPGTGPHRR